MYQNLLSISIAGYVKASHTLGHVQNLTILVRLKEESLFFVTSQNGRNNSKPCPIIKLIREEPGMVINHMTCSKEYNLMTRNESNVHLLVTINGLIRTEIFVTQFLTVIFSINFLTSNDSIQLYDIYTKDV